MYNVISDATKEVDDLRIQRKEETVVEEFTLRDIKVQILNIDEQIIQERKACEDKVAILEQEKKMYMEKLKDIQEDTELTGVMKIKRENLSGVL